MKLHDVTKQVNDLVAGLSRPRKEALAMELIAAVKRRDNLAWRWKPALANLPDQAQEYWKPGVGKAHLTIGDDGRIGTLVGPAMNFLVVTEETHQEWQRMLGAAIRFVAKVPRLYRGSPTLWQLFREANRNAQWLESPFWTDTPLPFLFTRGDGVVGRKSGRAVLFELNQGNRGNGWMQDRTEDTLRILQRYVDVQLWDFDPDPAGLYAELLLKNLESIAKLRGVEGYDPSQETIFLVSRPDDKVASDVFAFARRLANQLPVEVEVVDPLEVRPSSNGGVETSKGEPIRSAVRLYTHPFLETPLDLAARQGKVVLIGKAGYKVMSDKLILALLASCKGVQEYARNVVGDEVVDLLLGHLNAEVEPQMSVLKVHGESLWRLLDIDPKSGEANWEYVKPENMIPDLVLKTAMDSGTHGVAMRAGKPEDMYWYALKFAHTQGKPIILAGRRTKAQLVKTLNAFGFLPGQNVYPEESEGVPRFEFYGAADFSDPENPEGHLTMVAAQVAATADLTLIHGSTTNTWLPIYWPK